MDEQLKELIIISIKWIIKIVPAIFSLLWIWLGWPAYQEKIRLEDENESLKKEIAQLKAPKPGEKYGRERRY